MPWWGKAHLPPTLSTQGLRESQVCRVLSTDEEQTSTLEATGPGWAASFAQLSQQCWDPLCYIPWLPPAASLRVSCTPKIQVLINNHDQDMLPCIMTHHGRMVSVPWSNQAAGDPHHRSTLSRAPISP